MDLFSTCTPLLNLSAQGEKMFAGIIQELATVVKKTQNSLTISSSLKKVAIGESMAVNGVCLTVSKINGSRSFLYFEVMPQTLRLTNLELLRIGDKINIERALRMGELLGGHIVSGHIDEVGKIVSTQKKGNAVLMEIKTKPENRLFIIPQSSIALDGVGLTIAEKKENGFMVSLIPQTIKDTTLGFKEIGDTVNIEYDQMVKATVLTLAHVPEKKHHITMEFLLKRGF